MKFLKGCFKKSLSLLLVLTVMSGVWMPAYSVQLITDHWAAETIDRWLNEGYLIGSPGGDLRLDDEITRVEFFAFANRLYGFESKEAIYFSDVDADAWYAEDVAKALAAGYVKGFEDQTVRPYATLTRQEIIVMIARMEGLEPVESRENPTFIDSDEMPDWSYKWIEAAARKGLVEGYEDGSFRPIQVMTRSESMVVIDRARAFEKEPLVKEEEEDEEEKEEEKKELAKSDEVTRPSSPTSPTSPTPPSQPESPAQPDKPEEKEEDPSESEDKSNLSVEKIHGKTVAKVSTAADLNEALDMLYVDEIWIMESMTIDQPIEKTVKLSQTDEALVVDFGGNHVDTLIVEGSNHQVKNAKIESIVIKEGVKDILFENVKDYTYSSHDFQGGGADSIRLQHGTTFQGEVRITSGEDIRIFALDENSSVKGTVSVESNRRVTVDAAVENLVVNTSGAAIQINAPVRTLSVRESAQVTLSSNTPAPLIEARMGTHVSVVDEEGKAREVEVKFVLDFYGLNQEISRAERLLELTPVGIFHGSVSQEAHDALSESLRLAVEILESKKAQEVSEANQKAIDAAERELNEAASQFLASRNFVDLSEIYQLLNEVDGFTRFGAAVIGDLPGQYPQSALDDLTAAIQSTRLTLRSPKLTEEKVQEAMTHLSKAFEAFKASRHEFDASVKWVSTLIQLDEIYENGYRVVDFAGMKTWGDQSRFNSMREIQEDDVIFEVVDEGLKVIVPISLDWDYEAYSWVISVNYSDYLIFVRLDQEELRTGKSFAYSADDFVEPKIFIEGQGQVQPTVIYEVDENGLGINQAWAGHSKENAIKVNPGTYSFCYIDEQEQFYLYTPGLEIKKDQVSYEFKHEDLAKISFEMNQKYQHNYELNYFFISKYASTRVLNMNPEKPWAKVNSGIENRMTVTYDFHYGEKKYAIAFSEHFKAYDNAIFQVSDDLFVHTFSQIQEGQSYAINSFLPSFHLGISNDLGQEVRINTVYHEDGTVERNRRESFRLEFITEEFVVKKDLEGQNLYGITFAELTGKPDYKGSFTLKVYTQDFDFIKPLVIEGYIH